MPRARRIYQIAIVALACSQTALAAECAACHPKEAAAFHRSAMGNSFGPATAGSSATFVHERSGATVSVRADAQQMRHRLETKKGSEEHGIQYFIGSGHVGQSFVLQKGTQLFQSPAAFMTAGNRWGLSPGYDAETSLNFRRPITPECLFCHAAGFRPAPQKVNHYQVHPVAITCDRCHGDGSNHSRRPSASNIVNPARLKERARDSVCEQCHLSGEARILNPGRQFMDFRPGQDLEEVFSVYIDSAPSVGLKVVSHSEHLAESECAKASRGALWCGSCHDPHGAKVDHRARCVACHASNTHAQKAKDCTGCHMPRMPTYDGAHTLFTDHRIRRKPLIEKKGSPVSGHLTAWRESKPSLRTRNLGLAYISAGQKRGNAAWVDKGFRVLAPLQQDFAADPAVLSALAYGLLGKGRAREAASLFSAAVKLEPADPRHRMNLATALRASGDLDGSRRSAEAALALDHWISPE